MNYLEAARAEYRLADLAISEEAKTHHQRAAIYFGWRALAIALTETTCARCDAPSVTCRMACDGKLTDLCAEHDEEWTKELLTLKSRTETTVANTKTALERCPFCGQGECFDWERNDIDSAEKLVAPACASCGARGPMWGTRQQAAEAWNSRAGAVR